MLRKACRRAACPGHHGGAAGHGRDGMTQTRHADGSVQQHWWVTIETGQGTTVMGIAALSKATAGARVRLA
jgi:hypothetical protein